MRRVSSQRTASASRSACSTRSVTSSRFPIGVAQTRSGTARLAVPVERLEPDETRADEACLVAEGGRHHLQRLVRRPIASRRAAASAGSRSTSHAAAPKPPPTTTTSGTKMFVNDPIAIPT